MPLDPPTLYSCPDFEDLKYSAAEFLVDFQVSGWRGGRNMREGGRGGPFFV